MRRYQQHEGLRRKNRIASRNKGNDGEKQYCRRRNRRSFISLKKNPGAKVGATLRESDEKIRISLRSFGDTNVAEIAAKFDGGGHVKAAGCSFKGDIESAEKALLEEIRKTLI